MALSLRYQRAYRINKLGPANLLCGYDECWIVIYVRMDVGERKGGMNYNTSKDCEGFILRFGQPNYLNGDIVRFIPR